jgi:hypothetical protein
MVVFKRKQPLLEEQLPQQSNLDNKTTSTEKQLNIIMKKTIFIAALFILNSFIGTIVFANSAFAATLFTAKVDRNTLSMQETLTLTLRFHEQVIMGEPDLSELKQNFDILGQSRNNQYRSVNGQSESWTQWKITLAPKREGRLLIPSFPFRKSFTDAIEINVIKTPVISSNKMNDQPVFMEVDLEKDNVFVQEQILYTMRLFTSVNLNGLDSTDLVIENAIVKKISESQYQKQITGKNYGVVEVKYAIFAQKSGTLTIPSTLWTVVTQANRSRSHDPFYTRSTNQRLNLRAPERSVTVLPQPQNYTSPSWLPAQAITLEQTWGKDPSNFVVGEPITRTIKVKAQGLTAAQLPPLDITEISGLSYYPDQPQVDEQLSGQGITTIKSESYAIVANKPGKLTLPSIVIEWWDTQAQKIRKTRLPVEDITVGGTIAKTAPVVSPSPTTPKTAANQIPTDTAIAEKTSTSNVWLYLTFFNALIALIFIGLWWHSKTSPQKINDSNKPILKESVNSAKYEFQQLLKQLDLADPMPIRNSIIAWGKAYFSEENILNLLDVAQALNNPEFDLAVKTLDDHLYGNEDNRLPKALLDSIKQAITQQQESTKDSPDSALKPLYS